ncbi:MAG: fluoride efflux transporter CrcB [Gemmatimonadota bacterium]
MIALAVAIGGAAGALGRYAVTSAMSRAFGEDLPWGTFAVNVTGSFLLGFLLIWMSTRAHNEELSALLTVGFLGSFTTFSTFSFEAVALARSGAIWKAATYAGGSVMIGVLAVSLGMAAAMAFDSTSN